MPLRLALAVLLACAGAAEAGGQPQQSFWSLVVNEVPKGEVLAVLDGGRMWLPVAALEKAGVKRFEGRRETLFGEVHVQLASLEPDIVATLDTTEVVVRVTAAARFFDETLVALQRARPSGVIYSSTTSGFLNYSATWDYYSGTSGFGEAGVSLFGHTSIASGFSVEADGRLIRGLSTLTVDRPGARQRFQVGDLITPVTPLGSGPLLGGVSFGRDYSVDPYYNQFAAPFVRGTATRPSDVEVYVNGALVRRLQIGPGPYRLDRLPLNTGLGNVSVVVRDRLGGRQTYQSSVYVANAVVKRGEQDYQYAAGLLRDDSAETPVYDDWSGTAFHRVGVTDSLTLGYAAEGTEQVVAGGPTVSMRLGRLGEMELQAWASGTRERTRGFAAYGLYTFASRFLNLGATAQYLDPGFSNIYLEPGAATTPEFYQATAGIPVLSGSVNYTWEAKRSPAGNFGLTLPDGSFDETIVRSRSHSLRASFRLLRGTQLSTTATLTDVRGERVWSGFAALNIALTRHTTTSATYSDIAGTKSTYADINRSLPIGPGYGYRLTASDLDEGTASAQFEVNTRRNRLRVTYDAAEGGEQQNASATIAGGLIVTRGGAFLTRELETSAAVVEVTGLKRVRILADNVPIGRTNSRGRLLVPQLLPYLANRISYDESDIPFEFSVPVQSQLVAPPFRGVAYVRFPTARIQGRTGSVRVMDGDEEIVPSFGTILVRLEGRDVESPLNADGEFFLDLPNGHHTATVTFKGTSCNVEFDATTSKDLVQQLGRLQCRR